MLKKIILPLLAILVFTNLNTANSYSGEVAILDEGKTIKELNESIKKLGGISIKLENNLNILNSDFKLKSFLIDNLSELDIENIKQIADKYSGEKNKIELIIKEKLKSFQNIVEEKKELLNVKKEFYKGLVPYIRKEAFMDYLDYIRNDSQIFNEQSNISTNIVQKKEILNDKVEKIEEKIKIYNKKTEISVNNIIETRLQEKINGLKVNKSFVILSNKTKIKILDKSIRKIKIKLLNFENTPMVGTGSIHYVNNNLINKKIETYRIAILKLEDFKNSIK